jgi:lipopolysaccharide/colanic/teichoic acid biosynthesis glycosyltransferase
VTIVDAPVTRPPAMPAPIGRRWPKRAVDLVVGVPLCLLAGPVVLLLAAVLAVHHRGNPFFVHERIGFGGRPVRIPKLRTLASSTPPYADKTATELQVQGRLARWLRVTHLDELPQLFIVPLGRLSLVGPRPRMMSEAVAFANETFDAQRVALPQGLTGLWQVGAGHNARVSDHPEFDLFYVRNQTLRLDLWILWRTLAQALGGRPVELDRVPNWTLRSRVIDLDWAG